MLEENEAIMRAKKGDLSGLKALVEMHQQDAIHLAALIVQDSQLAQDIVSDSFLKAYDRIDQFDENRPFMPWFRRIIINDALKRISRHKRFIPLDGLIRRKENETRTMVDLAALIPDPSDAVERSEIKAIVRRAINSLTAKQRAVVVLRYYFDLSEAEIAETLNIPRGTVKSRVAASMGRLSGLLSELRSLLLSLL